MGASDRHQSLFADVESDDGDMRGCIVPRPIERKQMAGRAFGKQILERDDAIGQIRSERADVAYGKYFRRRLPRELTMIVRPDAAAGDQRLGADARQRGNSIGAAPKQRQRRGDHAGAQHAEHGQDILDDVRQLNADNGVGRQPHAAESGGNRGDGAIGGGVTQAPRFAADDIAAVCRIGERQRVRPPPHGVVKEFADGDAAQAIGALGCRDVGIAENHCSDRFGSRHHVSGR